MGTDGLGRWIYDPRQGTTTNAGKIRVHALSKARGHGLLVLCRKTQPGAHGDERYRVRLCCDSVPGMINFGTHES